MFTLPLSDAALARMNSYGDEGDTDDEAEPDALAITLTGSLQDLQLHSNSEWHAVSVRVYSQLLIL